MYISAQTVARGKTNLLSDTKANVRQARVISELRNFLGSVGIQSWPRDENGYAVVPSSFHLNLLQKLGMAGENVQILGEASPKILVKQHYGNILEVKFVNNGGEDFPYPEDSGEKSELTIPGW